MEDYGAHTSVLKEESLNLLLPEDRQASFLFADMTFGAGGHSFAVRERYPNADIMAVDQDKEAIEAAAAKLRQRIELLHMNYSDFPSYFTKRSLKEGQKLCGPQAILMDLGVSSHQFDSEQRGFSFRFDAPLDMRMNTSSCITAASLLRDLSEEELTQVFSDYGEERFSKRIASKIVEQRLEGEIVRTKQLEDIIFHCYPKKLRFGRIHPATRCFQALRIAVNRELDVLRDTLPLLFSILAPGGKLGVISFHSLEDRIVKHSFKSFGIDSKILTKKPVVPSTIEIQTNKRARSAKLRVIQKTLSGDALAKKEREA